MSTPQPDFLRPVRGPHRLAWSACAVAGLVLTLAALEAWQAWDALTEAQVLTQAQTAQRLRAVPGAASTASAARAAATAATADTPARRATRQALLRLQRPWPEMLAAIESAQVAGVAWLTLDVGEQGTLRLEGLAPDAAAALAAAEALRADPMWRDVVLARLDTTPTGSQRFALLATPAAGAW